MAQLPLTCHPSGSAAGESEGPPGVLLLVLGGVLLLGAGSVCACVRCIWTRWRSPASTPRRICLPSGLVVSVPDGADR